MALGAVTWFCEEAAQLLGLSSSLEFELKQSLFEDRTTWLISIPITIICLCPVFIQTE